MNWDSEPLTLKRLVTALDGTTAEVEVEFRAALLWERPESGRLVPDEEGVLHPLQGTTTRGVVGIIRNNHDLVAEELMYRRLQDTLQQVPSWAVDSQLSPDLNLDDLIVLSEKVHFAEPVTQAWGLLDQGSEAQ